MTGNGEPVKIVVGVHGSRSSLDALAWAHRQSRLTNAELHVVVSGWTIPINQGRVPVSQANNYAEAAEAVLDQALAKALDPADAGRIRRHVVQGHPVRVLLDAAKDADLLVVGSGTDGSTGGELSSLCRELLARAPCTVVLVRSHAESDPSTDPSGADLALAEPGP